MKKDVKKESIKFRAQAVVYKNENGFKIIAGIAFSSDTGERLCRCSIKGELYDVNEGDNLFASGYWDEHPKYGTGFVVDAYIKIVPQDKASIFNYLKQGNIERIGAKKAQLIVDAFGENTFDVLVNHTNLLSAIKGIGKKSIEAIKKSAQEKLSEQQLVTTLMKYIQGFDISPAYAAKIYKRYGVDSIKVIKENPYKLADEVKGIGFLKADEIALKNGIPKDSPFRIDSAVLYTLNKINDDGHVFGIYNQVISLCTDMLMLDESYVKKSIERLVEDKKIVREDDAVYPAPLYYAELNSANKLADMINAYSNKSFTVSEDSVKKFGKSIGIEYAEEQISAIVTACNSNVMVLTGGPGTGKTTTVNGIIKMFKKHGLKVECAAPTGKAAKRMKETTGEPAQTIHKMLEIHMDKDENTVKFGRNASNPLTADALIIDESSMIDMMMLNAILKASPTKMKLVFVGDIDQLPSVGCGNVLNDIIQSGIIPVVKLKTIFRQAQQSDIVKNAHLINEGIVPDFKNSKTSDYFFMNTDNMEQDQIRDAIVYYVCEKLPKYYNVKAEDIQVLAPMKKGHTGVIELNSFLQNKINPPATNKPIIPCNGQIFRVGDKVMCTTNDYDNMVFNGDIGKIVRIFDDKSQCNEWDNDDTEDSGEEEEKPKIKRGFTVNFDGREVSFCEYRIQDFVLAYATTIHKSQGSEYDIVVMPLTNANYVMLQRNLLYTGITRAKKVFVLFGQKRAVALAVRTLKTVKRNTKLSQRIVYAEGLLAYVNKNEKAC